MIDKMMRGRAGEREAVRFLLSKGYAICAQNYRFKRAEIDIIATKNDWLVFLEVKLRTSATYGFPEEQVSDRQRENIMAAAQEFILSVNWQGRVRYDIISILRRSLRPPEILHVEDAFY